MRWIDALKIVEYAANSQQYANSMPGGQIHYSILPGEIVAVFRVLNAILRDKYANYIEIELFKLFHILFVLFGGPIGGLRVWSDGSSVKETAILKKILHHALSSSIAERSVINIG